MGLYQAVLQSADGGNFVNLRDGAGTNLTSTLLSGKQSLDVNVANSISVGVADKTTFVYGTTSFLPVGGVFQDTSPTLTAGQSGAGRLTANRGLHVNLRDASGNELGAANASGVFVRPGDGTNTQAYSATLEAFVQLRQGGNVANVTAANELKTIDTNSGLINGKLSPATATLSQLALSTSSQTALASNASRKGFVAVNESNKLAYIAFSATASATVYTYKIQPNSTIEPNFGSYTGVISAISVSGVSGNLVLTELT